MAALDLLSHGEGDLVQAHRRSRLPHRQIHEACGHPVADPAGVISAVPICVIHADGNHRADGRRILDGLTTGEQPGPQRSRDRCEDNVIDGDLVRVVTPCEPTANSAKVLQIHTDDDIAPRLTDLGVEGACRAGRTAVLATVETSAPTAENTGRLTALTSVMAPRTFSAIWLGRRMASTKADATSSTSLGSRAGCHVLVTGSSLSALPSTIT